MLKIGDFSKLCRLSVKALRYYDEVGLLRPARTDPVSGYRYYSVEQLPRLNRVLALKDLGFTLEQIAQLLDEPLPPERIRGMLHLKRAQARQQIEAEQARLARIEARLRQIEREETMPDYEVVLKSVEAQRVASVRAVLPTFPAVGGLFDELRDYARKHDVRATAWTAVWHDTEYRERDVDGEAAITTDGPLPGDGRVSAGELPAVETMACAVHHGPFDTITQAYAAVLGWIEANGYRIVGPNREIYYRGGNDQHDPSFVTEVQFPVARE